MNERMRVAFPTEAQANAFIEGIEYLEDDHVMTEGPRLILTVKAQSSMLYSSEDSHDGFPFNTCVHGCAMVHCSQVVVFL